MYVFVCACPSVAFLFTCVGVGVYGRKLAPKCGPGWERAYIRVYVCTLAFQYFTRYNLGISADVRALRVGIGAYCVFTSHCAWVHARGCSNLWTFPSFAVYVFGFVG